MKVSIQKFLVSFALVLMVCLTWGATTYAAETYQVTEQDGKLTCTVNEVAVTDCYVCLKQSGSNYTVVKPGTKNGKVYYFNVEGTGKVFKQGSFITITYKGKTNTYYANKNGVLEKNKIVGSKKQGYYYVDANGIQIKSNSKVKAANKKATKKGNYKKTDYNAQCIEYAVKFVRQHGGSGSDGEKLKKCFYYLSSHYKYKRTYSNLYPSSAIMDDFAYEMFSTKKGNCHRYAATFAYIAKVLGYDSLMMSGETTSRSGGWTPHGWSKVKVSGKWYICDPDMQMMGISAYMKSTHPCRVRKSKKHTLYAKNGKVYWK